MKEKKRRERKGKEKKRKEKKGKGKERKESPPPQHNGPPRGTLYTTNVTLYSVHTCSSQTCNVLSAQ